MAALVTADAPQHQTVCLLLLVHCAQAWLHVHGVMAVEASKSQSCMHQTWDCLV